MFELFECDHYQDMCVFKSFANLRLIKYCQMMLVWGRIFVVFIIFSCLGPHKKKIFITIYSPKKDCGVIKKGKKLPKNAWKTQQKNCCRPVWKNMWRIFIFFFSFFIANLSRTEIIRKYNILRFFEFFELLQCFFSRCFLIMNI